MKTDITPDVVLDRDLGARVVADGTLFTVWAPRHTSVAVVVDDVAHDMERLPDSYFRLHLPGVGAGRRYWYQIAEGRRPDPVSRFQPDGVFGPSMVVDDDAFDWSDDGWPGAVPAHRQVIYEMHVGTFTPAGTWAAAQERLRALASIGITTIEVMPIAEFGGRFGWGYDGVFFFAPFHHYGTPDDAKRFIDAAHAAGLAVILDVVYNHIGPVGSVLQDFGDQYFAAHESEWGRGFNLDGADAAPVRQFMRANVLHWIADYHFDGLRFDAIHAVVDRSPEHLIDELTRCCREACAPRRLFMVAENEAQEVSYLTGGDKGLAGVDATWNEDWHHSIFVALTGRREAYFTDYAGTAAELAAMARWNLLYQGQWYSWQKKGRGTDARHLPSSSFVSFLENHDQVANTGFGTRLCDEVGASLWRAMTAVLLLGPQIPMLFQGQERASTEPFTYFADHEGDLAEAVRKGRMEFLSQFASLRDRGIQRLMPAPSDASAFHRCQLRWTESRNAAETLKLHADLLALRRNDPVLSTLGTPDTAIASAAPTASVLILRYQREHDERLILLNLNALTTLEMSDPLLAAPSGQKWDMTWCSDHADYGGRGIVESFGEGQWKLQPHCAWLLRNVAAPTHP
ncbi:MAG TPA: malto-oligosyltrehalose trehalohydrolase [Vicinamibacterales bacterium]|jgi:maltooligosyltrehalose trehalohydrolase